MCDSREVKLKITEIIRFILHIWLPIIPTLSLGAVSTMDYTVNHCMLLTAILHPIVFSGRIMALLASLQYFMKRVA